MTLFIVSIQWNRVWREGVVPSSKVWWWTVRPCLAYSSNNPGTRYFLNSECCMRTLTNQRYNIYVIVSTNQRSPWHQWCQFWWWFPDHRAMIAAHLGTYSQRTSTQEFNNSWQNISFSVWRIKVQSQVSADALLHWFQPATLFPYESSLPTTRQSGQSQTIAQAKSIKIYKINL